MRDQNELFFLSHNNIRKFSLIIRKKKLYSNPVSSLRERIYTRWSIFKCLREGKFSMYIMLKIYIEKTVDQKHYYIKPKNNDKQ